ncbi:MAG: MBOAT family protein [Chloroflexi bacterium]|nr:MBOAT family protein [Chloroflexota bacterium]
MLFNSLQYAVFLPATWLVYWGAPARWRVHLLLLASYVFYATWSPPYALMMFGLAVANFAFGRLLARSHRRTTLAACIAADLAVLGMFKYWDFGFRSASSLASAAGLAWDPPLLQLVLPLGISFFTFEFIHYLVDVYRGALPVHSFTRFHVFAAFFPTQVAGPIKRFQDFVPELTHLERFDWMEQRSGIALIVLGLSKKVLLADSLAPLANAGFDAGATGGLGTLEAWTAALAFSLQVYFDFSGYTDIALGSARLLGFHIPKNFDAPYLATSVTDFWRRWHISLSSWLRDYVYISLGGSRVPLLVVLRNVVLTMAIGGLWHGAAWHFVAWGVFWGALQAAERVRRTRLREVRGPLAGPTSWVVTQLLVLVSWVLFRSESIPAAGNMLRSMLVPTAPSGVLSGNVTIDVAILAAGLTAVSVFTRRVSVRVPRVLQPIALGIAVAVALAFTLTTGATPDRKFIYFQF